MLLLDLGTRWTSLECESAVGQLAEPLFYGEQQLGQLLVGTSSMTAFAALVVELFGSSFAADSSDLSRCICSSD